ncbi:3'(2'),5'-bisphosphate nucleotidase CysQ [Helicobacter muridarum]|uniref:3'(2'),5'-bisphosphate nucleotidase CysQ n=1 Tax=Helicobacter muridarum TaxID=216 RepID=A0A099TZ63_9HELI|nr:3'(2'),5'-bisphosphate nucleotidase CysQ [Helicobacter muridarum]TLE00167.1 3'(2'),5'-bisphosphate nucleotidase CysQ [Helicobacter muridarum]STQ87026.1 3'(2'),5'-bisphosphate nucleotidase CysQ [Helicobacter muridarum]
MLSNMLYDTICIAVGAGQISRNIFQEYSSTNASSYFIKDDASPITKADIQSNSYIMENLSTLYNYEICSEEAILEYARRKNLESYWLIDPLDGTKDFIAGIGEWTINIALVHRNEILLGVVYAPCVGELYFASKNQGSFLIDMAKLFSNMNNINELNPTEIRLDRQLLVDSSIRLHGGQKNKTSKIIACSSRFHNNNLSSEFIAKYDADILLLGSSLKICALASGKADIYPRFNGTKEWDIAASDIILRESGGIIIDYETKKPPMYNKETISNNYFVAFSSTQIGGVIYQDILSGLS